MKWMLLASALTISTVAVAQETPSATPPAADQAAPAPTAPPTDPAVPANAPQTTPPPAADQSMPAPAPATDPATPTGAAPAPSTDASDPAGGYQPSAPPISGTPQPGQQVIFQAAPPPDQAYPPPAPLQSYPVCKKGQTDGCRQRGG